MTAASRTEVDTIRKHVPNLLTALRLVVALAFPWLPPQLWAPAVGLALVTEWLDGHLARRWDATSRLGRLLDPIADKLFVLAVGATAWLHGLLSVGALAAILPRDVVVTAGSLWCLVRRDWGAIDRMRPRMPGKVATAAQFAYLLALLLAPAVATALLVFTCLASVVAAVDYMRAFLSGRARP